MLGRTVGIIATSALSAQALLLPPNVAQAEADAGLSTLAIDTTSQSIKLPCSECAFSSSKPEESVDKVSGDDTFWIQGRANSILLEFKVSEEGHSMGMNGLTIYPNDKKVSNNPTVTQVDSSASLADIKASSVDAIDLHVSLSTTFIDQETVSPDGDAVVRVTYQLLSVEGQPITVDGAEVTMLKDADGKLMILNVEAVPKAHSIFDSLPPAVSKGDDKAPKECSNLPAFMCKLKNAIKSKVEDIKAGMPKMKGGCRGGKGKKLPTHIKPHLHAIEDDGRPEHHHGGRPKHGMRPHHGPHGHHHGHHGHHRHMHFWHRFIKGFVMILIPVMAGITMGITASLLGMLVGRLISFLWIKFARGGQRGYASVAQQESEAESGEKTEIIIEEEVEPLPRYEDAPAYEEKEQQ